MIGEGKTRGQAAILRVYAAHNQNTASIGVSDTAVLPEYVCYFLESRYAATRRGGSGSSQPALNKALVQRIALPLPPVMEQQHIVVQVDRLLSESDNLGKVLQASLTRSERLRQAILKRAFSGELVPQDPNDEPASVLLERIQAEREKTPAPKRRGHKYVRTRSVEEGSDA